jgi:hypothetical protein
VREKAKSPLTRAFRSLASLDGAAFFLAIAQL